MSLIKHHACHITDPLQLTDLKPYKSASKTRKETGLNDSSR
jgi:hypothetical protein